jgi:tetratricopeptide (TPR) repeat protein
VNDIKGLVMRDHVMIMAILMILLVSVSGQKDTTDQLLAKGNDFILKEDYASSVPFFDKALNIDPENPQALNGKGLALQNLGKHDESIAYFDKAIKLNPKYTEAWFNKGWSMVELDQYDAAIECFKKALEIDPSYCDAANDLGVACYYSRNYEDAENWYKKTLELCPERGETWYNLGLLYLDLGRAGDANDAYLMSKKFGFEGPEECETRFQYHS